MMQRAPDVPALSDQSLTVSDTGREETAVPSTRQRIEGRVARLLSALPGGLLLKLIGEPPHVVDGRTLDPHVQFILAARRRQPQRLMSGPTPAAARRRYQREVLAATIDAGARPTRVRAVRDITIDGAAGPLRARHYLPSLAQDGVAAPVLLYLHGGGFVNGNIITHDEPCRLLCQAGDMHVISLDYRLAPEHPFPAALDDAHAALRWVQREAAALGADPRRVAVGGDSAGANLATVVATEATLDGRPPAAQLLIYPTVDMDSRFPSRTLFGSGYILTSADMDAFRHLYLGDLAPDQLTPRMSPLLNQCSASTPPALVVTAGFDPLRDEGEVYADQLREAGCPLRLQRFSGLVHGFLHMTSIVPAAHRAVVETARMFRGLLREESARG